MTDKKEEKKACNFSCKKIVKTISKNYWIISTIVLATLLIVSLFVGGSLTCSSIGADKAAQRVVEFYGAQGIDLTIEETKDLGSIYEITASAMGQEGVIYTTKDGEYMGSMMPLTAAAITDSSEPETQDIPKSDKPTAELFVMTHCPYGTQAEKGILPVIDSLKDVADVKIRFVHYFMHDPEEEETPRQICIREEQSTKYNDYLSCFLEDGDAERCLTESKIDKNALTDCITKRAEKYYEEDSTLSQGYGVGGSPTLVINGIQASSARDSASYLAIICSAFNEAPEACSTQLSTTSPSPGFGYEAGSATTATC